MSERERICACAEQANHRYQQWMPQRWLDFFIEAWEASASAPPADVAGRIEHLKYLLLTPRGRNGEIRLTAETVQGTIDALAALARERDQLREALHLITQNDPIDNTGKANVDFDWDWFYECARKVLR